MEARKYAAINIGRDQPLGEYNQMDHLDELFSEVKRIFAPQNEHAIWLYAWSDVLCSNLINEIKNCVDIIPVTHDKKWERWTQSPWNMGALNDKDFMKDIINNSWVRVSQECLDNAIPEVQNLLRFSWKNNLLRFIQGGLCADGIGKEMMCSLFWRRLCEYARAAVRAGLLEPVTSPPKAEMIGMSVFKKPGFIFEM